MDGAIADYRKALEIDPDDAITLNNLGLLEEQYGMEGRPRAVQARRHPDGHPEGSGVDPADALAKPAEPATPAETTKETESTEPAGERSLWGEVKAVFTTPGRGKEFPVVLERIKRSTPGISWAASWPGCTTCPPNNGRTSPCRPPGRRAARKLADALAGTVPPGTWLPRFTTLGEWSAEVQRVSTPSKLELLVELQQVAESMRADLTLPEWDSFERFQPWGLAALGDFNNIDHHLLEARQVFRDLRNIKDIEAWSSEKEKNSKLGQLLVPGQWNALLPLYDAFHAHLRSVAQQHDGRPHAPHGRGGRLAGSGDRHPLDGGSQCHDAGRTPHRRKLVRAGKAEWIWDTDPTYVRNDMEAGRFIREMVPPAQWQELPHPMEDATLAGPEPTRQWNMVTCSSPHAPSPIHPGMPAGNGPGRNRPHRHHPAPGDLAPTVMTAMPPASPTST